LILVHYKLTIMKEVNLLVKKYPEFFEYLKEYQGPSMPVALFGIECGNGWFMLLDELMSGIQNHIKNKNLNRDRELRSKFATRLNRLKYRLPYKRKQLKKILEWVISKYPKGVEHTSPIYINQIKEKFGGLRFYYSGGDDYIDGMTSLAEDMSYNICEQCGSTENVGQTNGWISVMCEKCAKKNDIKNWEEYKE